MLLGSLSQFCSLLAQNQIQEGQFLEAPQMGSPHFPAASSGSVLLLVQLSWGYW